MDLQVVVRRVSELLVRLERLEQQVLQVKSDLQGLLAALERLEPTDREES